MELTRRTDRGLMSAKPSLSATAGMMEGRRTVLENGVCKANRLVDGTEDGRKSHGSLEMWSIGKTTTDEK